MRLPTRYRIANFLQGGHITRIGDNLDVYVPPGATPPLDLGIARTVTDADIERLGLDRPVVLMDGGTDQPI